MGIGMWLLLALAGAVGTLCRLGIVHLIGVSEAPRFPTGTLVVNLVGCLFFGIVWGLSQPRGMLSPEMRLVLLGGFAGAFTTFSTFAFDIVHLLRAEMVGMAVLYVVLSNTIGVVLVYVGMRGAGMVV